MEKWIELYLMGYPFALVSFIAFRYYTKRAIYGNDFVKAFLYTIAFSWCIVITFISVCIYDLGDWITELDFWKRKIV